MYYLGLKKNCLICLIVYPQKKSQKTAFFRAFEVPHYFKWYNQHFYHYFQISLFQVRVIMLAFQNSSLPLVKKNYDKNILKFTRVFCIILHAYVILLSHDSTRNDNVSKQH